MNLEYVNGFVKTAMQFGFSEIEAIEALDKAIKLDPKVAMDAGIGAPPPPGPEQMAEGQPELPSGLPPELEQLIESLPPEVLQQLLAELEQEVNGGMGAPQEQQMPPQMPEQQKQASFTPPSVLAKTAEYAEGFIAAAMDAGADRYTATQLYKKASADMEAAAIDQRVELDTYEKRASHFDGFVKAATYQGLTVKQAEALYTETFLK